MRSRAASPTRGSSGSSPSSGRSTSTPSLRAACATTSSRGRRRADDLVPLYAELDARAASSGIDEETAEQLLLRLRERRLERELQTADAEHLRDLQIALQKVRTAFREFA